MSESFKSDFAIAGGGLAGCEAAWALASHGFHVALLEQKPLRRSPAHKSDLIAELVCSNSLRSADPLSAVGMLKEEMRALYSLIMAAADATRVPADKALAVDRHKFSAFVHEKITSHPNIRLMAREVEDIADPYLHELGPKGVILAAGPLASEALSSSLAAATGAEHCFFYDAIAPIIWTDSVNREIAFRGSRHEQTEGEGDYLNCPMTKEEYERFYEALLSGKTCPAREFERERHFEGCMPIEALASRGPKTLNFGPLKPIGFIDPRTGKRPWAVLQLRAEDAAMQTCNLVGCQTKLLQKEQERVFRLVPGLERAEFARFGSMHRNTYVNAPRVLAADLSLVGHPQIYLAGQITGVEGYVESAACGLWLGHALAHKAKGRILPAPSVESALGALLGHLRAPARDFQPSNVNFGLMPPPERHLPRKERKNLYAARGQRAFAAWRALLALP